MRRRTPAAPGAGRRRRAETRDRRDLVPSIRARRDRCSECTGSPSSSTVQAPQSPASQPFFTSRCPARAAACAGTGPGAGRPRRLAVDLEPHAAPASSLADLLGEHEAHAPRASRRRRAGRCSSPSGTRHGGCERPRHPAVRRTAARSGVRVAAVTVKTAAASASTRPVTTAPDRPSSASAILRKRGRERSACRGQVDRAQHLPGGEAVRAVAGHERCRRSAGARRHPASR